MVLFIFFVRITVQFVNKRFINNILLKRSEKVKRKRRRVYLYAVTSGICHKRNFSVLCRRISAEISACHIVTAYAVRRLCFFVQGECKLCFSSILPLALQNRKNCRLIIRSVPYFLYSAGFKLIRTVCTHQFFINIIVKPQAGSNISARCIFRLLICIIYRLVPFLCRVLKLNSTGKNLVAGISFSINICIVIMKSLFCRRQSGFCKIACGSYTHSASRINVCICPGIVSFYNFSVLIINGNVHIANVVVIGNFSAYLEHRTVFRSICRIGYGRA